MFHIPTNILIVKKKTYNPQIKKDYHRETLTLSSPVALESIGVANSQLLGTLDHVSPP